jgi:CRP/FNR family transcriptional regulator
LTITAPPAVLDSSLAGLALFASLSPGELAAIEPVFRRSELAAAAVIFFEGEPPHWLYIVLGGHVKLIKHSADGRDIILYIAMPGDLIGGVSAFGRRPHPFTAQAMVPATVLRVAGPDFAAVMEAHPAVARQTLDDLIERLTEAHEMMKSLAVERVERRIARQLLKLAARAGRPVAGGVEISVPLSRQDVADLAGTTVETAIRVLSRWRRAEIVRTAGGHLVVVDAAALEVLAEEGGG